MKAADVIHVHRRTDLWLIRDLFFICIANSFFFFKNRENAICRIKNKKRNCPFLLLITMWDNQLVLLDLIQQSFLPQLEYTEHETRNPVTLFPC